MNLTLEEKTFSYLNFGKSKPKTNLSHGHNDHTGGLSYLMKQYPQNQYKIVAHPDVFRKRMEEGRPIGAPVCKEQMDKVARLNLSKDPVKISEHITFLGEIPVQFDLFRLSKSENLSSYLQG